MISPTISPSKIEITRIRLANSYDPVDYPNPLLADLTPDEPTGAPPARWPANPALPEQYDGPPPSREFETAGLGTHRTGRALAPDAAPGPSTVQPSTSPPPPYLPVARRGE